MRAVVQRVTRSEVSVGGRVLGRIGAGLNVLVGIGLGDTERDVEWLANKIVNLRVFEDGDGKMNLSARDAGGELLIISQFTLYGDCRKGNRPSFAASMPPEAAMGLYGKFMSACAGAGLRVETGEFGADMKVLIENDGPVTLIIDSRGAGAQGAQSAEHGT
ncbi:MAG: D-tyrosyl-tRNA(Tyr) deacylase [Clostridiales bacterium]|jgi:D-tyrosyl-tRNA(Tyr) deacylase|nr:D-tyrosyl-tRNA(Tyr) deacylase [Clostridiales bacterium]